MDTVLNVMNEITPHQWFLIGGLIATIPGTIAIVAWVKKHHFKVKGEKLWSGFVVLNVAVWGTILTAADAVLNNLGQVTHIGSLIPAIAPFVSVWGPRVSITVLIVHSVASALRAWWLDRQAKKPISNINLPDFAPQVQAVTSNGTPSGQPSSSLGSVSVGSEISAPPANLFE